MIWKLKNLIQCSPLSLNSRLIIYTATNFVISSEDQGLPYNLNNRMWFPTDADVRNVIRASGGELEVDRTEEIVKKLQHQGDEVYYKYDPSQVRIYWCLLLLSHKRPVIFRLVPVLMFLVFIGWSLICIVFNLL